MDGVTAQCSQDLHPACPVWIAAAEGHPVLCACPCHRRGTLETGRPGRQKAGGPTSLVMLGVVVIELLLFAFRATRVLGVFVVVVVSVAWYGKKLYRRIGRTGT